MFSPLEHVKFVKGLAPAADRWNTGPATDVVSMKNYNRCTFLVHQEGGTTGNATFTVEACDDVTPSNTTAIAFRSRVGASGAGAGGDDLGDITNTASTGLVTTAATDRIYMIEITADMLPAGKPFVRLKSVETTNDPVNGSIVILLSEPRYTQNDHPTAIA